MGRERRLKLLLALLSLALLGAAPRDRCAGLSAPVGVELLSAERIGGPLTAPIGEALVAAPGCRVRGIARPTPASRVGFELWLPDAWTGRYYQLGNGGFAGNISLPALAADAARGNAVASTDTGHIGDGFDARWASGNPEAVIDYGHRSIKATSDAARALVMAYYGRPPRHRYYAGCSNGGRQALMAAQRYPDDWDGIIAGAPANLWTAQLKTFVALQSQFRDTPGAMIPLSALPQIQQAALAACPPGSVENGIALRPDECRLDPRTLSFLTPPQRASLAAIIAAGYSPTAAAYPENWSRWIVNPDRAAQSQALLGDQAAGYLLPVTPPSTLDANRLDYRRFAAHGGKIISYFGWADAVLSPARGLAYYRAVAGASSGDARRFYRLFMVPGMLHCQGGLGATSFGQAITAPASGPDPEHDIRSALEAWVEAARPPERLVAAGNGTSRVLLPVR